MTDINNTDEVVETDEEVVTTTTPAPEINDDPSVTDEGNKGGDTNANKDQVTEPVEEKLYSDEELATLEADFANNPDLARLKPLWDTKMKQLQAGFTKKTQSLAELRKQAGQDRKDAEAYRLQKAQPQTQPGNVQTQAKQEVADVLAKVMETASPAQQEYLKWMRPILDTIIDSKLAPVMSKVTPLEEGNIKNDLAGKYKFIDVEGSWPAVQQIRKSYPNMPHEEALLFSVKEQLPAFMQAKQIDKAKDTQRNEQGFIIGGGAPTKLNNGLTAEQKAKMSPEQFEKALNLPRAEN